MRIIRRAFEPTAPGGPRPSSANWIVDRPATLLAGEGAPRGLTGSGAVLRQNCLSAKPPGLPVERQNGKRTEPARCSLAAMEKER